MLVAGWRRGRRAEGKGLGGKRSGGRVPLLGNGGGGCGWCEPEEGGGGVRKSRKQGAHLVHWQVLGDGWWTQPLPASTPRRGLFSKAFKALCMTCCPVPLCADPPE